MTFGSGSDLGHISLGYRLIEFSVLDGQNPPGTARVM